MKRAPQDKTRHTPVKSEAAKLKDMQKAYGLSTPKTKPAPTSKPSAVKISSSSASVSESSTRKTLPTNSIRTARNSTGSIVSKPDSLPTSRKSVPDKTESKQGMSKIVAASKANYAEKYGASGNRNSVKKTQETSNHTVPAGTGRKLPVSSSGSVAHSQSSKTPSKKVTSVSSTTSRLTSQKAPPPVMCKSEPAEDEGPADYDEDFEEDYESDFEAAESSEGEAEPEIEVVQPAPSSFPTDPSLTEIPDEDDNDKSSSIREFEKLEKMVAVEEQLEEEIRVEEIRRMSSTSMVPPFQVDSNDTIVAASISGESSEEEDDDDDLLGSSSVERKQNAFPLTTGFSVNSSAQNLPTVKSSVIAARKSAELKGTRSELIPTVQSTDRQPFGESRNDRQVRSNRGKIIQGMIRLDRVQVEIFHLRPYQYDRFMTMFSGNGRLQSSTQTENDKSDESAQTEPIEKTARWTQKPPTWSTTSSSCDIRIVRQEALGAGTDDIEEDLSSDDQKIHKQFDFLKNWEQLSKFILRSSRKMLYVLEAEQRIKLPAQTDSKGTLEKIKMHRGLSVLSKLPMHTLACDGEFVGCANGQSGPVAPDKTTNGNKKHTSKNLITIWSLKEPSIPLHFLRVWGHVSALKVHMIGRMVVSGNRDGSLNVWNLDESMCYHSQYQEQVIRTPSLNTSCMMPTHNHPIVGIEMFSESKNTFSLVSMDKEGLLITWSCYRSHDTLGDSSLSQYSSAWSTVHMSVRYEVQLANVTRDHLQITCFASFWDVDATTGFFFGTFNGYVGKGKIITEGASLPTTIIEKYQERVDSNPKVTCMDVSKTLNVLVMGCEDGRCRFFELSRKKMVLSLNGKQEPLRVRWSNRRHSVIYVATKDCLLIWDLLTSDMTPLKTVHLHNIQDFVLYSPIHKEYLVIITGNELIISTPVDEIKPLSSRDLSRMQSYFSLLC